MLHLEAFSTVGMYGHRRRLVGWLKTPQLPVTLIPDPSNRPGSPIDRREVLTSLRSPERWGEVAEQLSARPPAKPVRVDGRHRRDLVGDEPPLRGAAMMSRLAPASAASSPISRPIGPPAPVEPAEAELLVQAGEGTKTQTSRPRRQLNGTYTRR